MGKVTKKIKKLTDLLPDKDNFNKHSQFGMGLMEKSIRKFGFVEAGLISEDGVICSGNARQETAVNIGMDDVQIIDIDGTKPIYLRKKGLKSGTKEFSETALALNAVGKANLNFDETLIEEILTEEVMTEWGIEKTILPDAFTLPEGDKAPFQQMTFTLADKQAEKIKRCLSAVEVSGNMFGNENSHGNQLYKICSEWEKQSK